MKIIKPNQIAMMCEWYANGKQLRSLAKILGINEATIHKHLNTVYRIKIKEPEILVMESKVNYD